MAFIGLKKPLITAYIRLRCALKYKINVFEKITKGNKISANSFFYSSASIIGVQKDLEKVDSRKKDS